MSGAAASSPAAAAAEWSFSSLEDLHSLFGWAEYAVLASVLLVSASVGAYFAWRGQRTTSEYLQASRQMSLLPTTLSLACSFISAITILGTPSEMYVFGTQYWMIGLSYPLVLAATAYVYMPVFHKLQFRSAHEYLEKRFSRPVRIFASVCYILLTCLYLAIVVYAPSLALSQATGMQMDAAIAVTFVVCVSYTAIGGLKAVIWTNVFQAFCMLVSCLVVVIVGEAAAGGPGEVFKTNYESGRIELFNLDPSPLTRHTFWSQVVGGYFTWMTIYAINQTMIQRYLAVPNSRIAKKAIWLSGIAITVILSVVAYAGLVIYTYYKDCDPVSKGLVYSKDQLLPLFTLDLTSSGRLATGFPGFLVAGVFSGALSTVSGGLNSLSAVTLEDFVKIFVYKDGQGLSDERATTISKWIAVGYGVFSYLLIFMVKNIPGLVQAWLGIFGIFGGPVLGLFTLGMFFPRANSIGALTGGIASIVVMLWISLGGNFSRLNGDISYASLKRPVSVAGCPAKLKVTEPTSGTIQDLDWWPYLSIYELSYMWYACTACMLVILVGLPVSLASKSYKRHMTGNDEEDDVDPDLLCPAVENFLGWVPRRARRWVGRNRILASQKEYSKVAFGQEEEKEMEQVEKKEEEAKKKEGEEKETVEA